MPTRLPYGLSFVKPNAPSGDYTFTSGDVTPDVSMGTFFTNATSAVTITNFDGGERGKMIFLRCNSTGVLTVQNSAGGINLFAIVVTISAGLLAYSTSGNHAMVNRETIGFVHNGTDWSQLGTSVRI